MGPIQEVIDHPKEPTALRRREIHHLVIVVTVQTEVMGLLTEAAVRAEAVAVIHTDKGMRI